MGINSHFVAELSLAGAVLEVLGGLYLAYDLLGGQHGPLRTLTRSVTYSVIFATGYGVFLGWWFALVGALLFGPILGVEFSRRSKNKGKPIKGRLIFAALRSTGLGLAGWLVVNLRFAVVFTPLHFLMLGSTYKLGFSPSDSYRSGDRPGLHHKVVLASILRGVGVTVAAVLAGFAARKLHGIRFGLLMGVVVGTVSAIVGFFSPMVESWADALPGRTLGSIGTIMLIFGFCLQAVQYLLPLLNIQAH